MDIRVQRQGARLIFYPVGDMVADQSAEARDTIMDQLNLNRGVTQVVMDLRALTAIDSTGIGVLMGLRIHIKPKRIGFRVENPSPAAQATIDAMALHEVFGLEPPQKG